MIERERFNGITKGIIGAAIHVHRSLGPGLLESAYQACLAFELVKLQMRVEQQKPLPLIYDQVKLDCGYRIDLLVEGSVVVEIKSVDALAPIHAAQIITYLKLSGCKVGLLINFNVPVLKDGVRRFVNGKIYGHSPQRAERSTSGKTVGQSTRGTRIETFPHDRSGFPLCSQCPLW
jgi:GxxExxY protein